MAKCQGLSNNCVRKVLSGCRRLRALTALSFRNIDHSVYEAIADSRDTPELRCASLCGHRRALSSGMLFVVKHAVPAGVGLEVRDLGTISVHPRQTWARFWPKGEFCYGEKNAGRLRGVFSENFSATTWRLRKTPQPTSFIKIAYLSSIADQLDCKARIFVILGNNSSSMLCEAAAFLLMPTHPLLFGSFCYLSRTRQYNFLNSTRLREGGATSAVPDGLKSRQFL